LLISSKVKSKLLEKHRVTEKEIGECFLNRERTALKDDREEHQTEPPTLWVIAKTDHLRELKLVFMVTDRGIILKTAYEPNQQEIQIYRIKASLLPG
jgi:uncharacterized DUF497 family protein